MTFNVRDFEILPPEIVAMRPDDFLVKPIETPPTELRTALLQQAAGYSRAAMTVGEVLEALRNVAPQFVAKALAEFAGRIR